MMGVIASQAKQSQYSKVEIATTPLGPRNDNNDVFNRALEYLELSSKRLGLHPFCVVAAGLICSFVGVGSEVIA